MTQPLVSCLLCTHNARDLVTMLALASYLQQNYENRELVIIDDGSDRIADLIEDIPAVTYIGLGQDASSLSQKRNIGCRAASGELICHFDSDDWSGSRRVSDQVAMMQQPGAMLGGYSKAFWYDFVNKRASCYSGSIWGASMIYRTEYALAHPWDEKVTNAEDGPFQNSAREQNTIVSTDGGQSFVATMHSRNARRAAVGTPGFWPFVDLKELPDGFRKAAGI